MIAVTGAAGKTGRAVTTALTRIGLPVRALVRDAGRHVPGATETVPADATDPHAMATALRGCHAVYHLAPNVHPAEVGIGHALIEAARHAGVHRVVFHSVLRPQLTAMPHHEAKLRVEEALFDSGLDVTVLQPAPYQQNTLDAVSDVAADGVLPVPYRTDAPFTPVDLRDVAAAAARVLSEDGHGGATYELCGPRTLTPADQAETLAALLGREVRAHRVPPAEWQAAAERRGLTGYPLDTLLAMFRYYDTHGLPGNGGVLGWLLGRPATDFRDLATAELDHCTVPPPRH